MIRLYTRFDYSKKHTRPLESLLYKDRKIDKYVLFLPQTGKSLHDVFSDIKDLANIINCEQPIMLNDYKSHLRVFGSDLSDLDVYDIAIDGSYDLKPGLAQVAKTQPKQWMRLLAGAQRVYASMEDRGICDGYKRLDFDMKLTRTGRSRSTGFNLHGATIDCDLRPYNEKFDYFIHLDWIAADMRVAAIMSGDSWLNESFNESDPYTEISKSMDMSRSECKRMLLSGIYSMSTDNPIFEVFPQFKTWVESKIEQARTKGKLESILGREFIMQNDKISFLLSGMIQGSVAHAMHSVLSKLQRNYNIFLEMHDSIILLANGGNIQSIMEAVKPIMLHPFDGLLDSNPKFPFTISIGKRWKAWKRYCTVRQ